MKVEYIARIGLPARRTTQQQAKLAIRDRMFAQVVINAKRVLAVLVHEKLGHRGTGIRRDILHRRTRTGTGRHYHRVIHRPVLAKDRGDLGDRRFLLADSDVNTDHIPALLIDYRIEPDRRLARLAVTDDQLPLTLADRDHRIDTFQSRHQRLIDRLAISNARRGKLN